MRSALLLCLSVLAACSASAQSLPTLIAQSWHKPGGGGPKVDSIVHMHHNNRNSTVATIAISPYHPANGVYKSDTSILYQDDVAKARYRRKFNAARQLTEYLWEYLTPTGANIQYHEQYAYNAQMLLDTFKRWDSFATDDGYRFIHTYNSNGKLVKSVQHEWSKTINNWKDLFYVDHIYDNNKVVAWQGYRWLPQLNGWEPNRIDSFIATGAGSDSVHAQYNWTGTTFFQAQRHLYKRDAANHILSDSTIGMYGQFQEAEYYQYDAQGNLIARWGSLWHYPTQQVITGDPAVYWYNAQSQLTSVRRKAAPSSQTPTTYAWIDSFTYNIHGQVLTRATYDSTNNGLVLTGAPGIQYFYYAPPVNNVDKITTGNNLQLYPIPATTYINISMSFTKPQPFSVRIFDMQGRLVNSWQEAAQKDYKKQIPLTGMAPGQYTLHILAGSESVSRQFMVVR